MISTVETIRALISGPRIADTVPGLAPIPIAAIPPTHLFPRPRSTRILFHSPETSHSRQPPHSRFIERSPLVFGKRNGQWWSAEVQTMCVVCDSLSGWRGTIGRSGALVSGKTATPVDCYVTRHPCHIGRQWRGIYFLSQNSLALTKVTSRNTPQSLEPGRPRVHDRYRIHVLRAPTESKIIALLECQRCRRPSDRSDDRMDQSPVSGCRYRSWLTTGSRAFAAS